MIPETGEKQKAAARNEGVVLKLRRMLQAQPAAERCDFCNVELAPVHRHLLEVIPRKIICACDPCALRFQNVVAGRFALIPRDVHVIPDFRLSDAQWESLSIPINLAFLFYSTSKKGITALYPSPGGATESLLPLAHWEELTAQNPVLTQMMPDVEALLVHRVGPAREYFVAPVDVCFELVGLIRMQWRGLSGGDEVWRAISDFFARLKMSAGTTPARQGENHA